MADKFLATFNIVKGSPEDYVEILDAVERKYRSGDIKHYVRLGSLSTTYLLKSTLTASQLTQAFSKFIKKTTPVIIVKYIDNYWSLPSTDSEYLNEHNY